MLRETSGLKQDQKYSNDCPSSIMKDIKFQRGRLSRFSNNVDKLHLTIGAAT